MISAPLCSSSPDPPISLSHFAMTNQFDHKGAQVGNKNNSTAVVNSSKQLVPVSTHPRYENSGGNGCRTDKIYRVRNLNWLCESCNVLSNSQQQYEVHLMSTKHKVTVGEVVPETIPSPPPLAVTAGTDKPDQTDTNQQQLMPKSSQTTTDARSRADYSFGEFISNLCHLKKINLYIILLFHRGD